MALLFGCVWGIKGTFISIWQKGKRRLLDALNMTFQSLPSNVLKNVVLCR